MWLTQSHWDWRRESQFWGHVTGLRDLTVLLKTEDKRRLSLPRKTRRGRSQEQMLLHPKLKKQKSNWTGHKIKTWTNRGECICKETASNYSFKVMRTNPQTLMWSWITGALCSNAESHSVDLGWGLSFCILTIYCTPRGQVEGGWMFWLNSSFSHSAQNPPSVSWPQKQQKQTVKII